MGVAGQASAAATGRLVGALKAEGHEEGEDTFEKRLAIAQQLKVGGFIWKSAVMVRFSRVGLAAVPMCHPTVIRSRKLRRHNEGNALKSQDHHEGLRVSPLKTMECGKSFS